jgi:hypothetical protein
VSRLTPAAFTALSKRRRSADPSTAPPPSQEAFPDLRLEIEHLLTDGPAAAAAVYVTEGDALKSEHLFFDQMDFLGQLGLLPG